MDRVHERSLSAAPTPSPLPRVSLSSLLTEFARRAERAEALRSEREATSADSGDSDIAVEEREWEAVLGDGLG